MIDHKPFQQNFKWCCGRCWHTKQFLQPIYGKECPACSYPRPKNLLHKFEAACYALVKARDGWFDIVGPDQCPGCKGTHEVTDLVLCTKCEGNWFGGWEFRGYIQHFQQGGTTKGFGVDQNFEIVSCTEAKTA